jgi:hypothetical protein
MKWVERLANELETAGIHCWFDSGDTTTRKNGKNGRRRFGGNWRKRAFAQLFLQLPPIHRDLSFLKSDQHYRKALGNEKIYRCVR